MVFDDKKATFSFFMVNWDTAENLKTEDRKRGNRKGMIWIMLLNDILKLW